MQIMRHFSGEVTLGTVAARKVSYGLTDTAQQYANITNMINQSIADFLSEDCGVDAVYEQRDDNVKWLWINDIPFLFMQSSTSGSASVYGPYKSSGLSNFGTAFTSAYNKADYDFWLVFTGNPDTAFSLRRTNYSDAQPTATVNVHLEIMKTFNILTKKDGMAWNAFSNGITANASQSRNYYCCDAGDEGLDWDSFSQNYTVGFLYGEWATNETDIIPGQIPLVPFRIGPWSVPGTYQYPLGFDIVLAAGGTQITQNEMETGGRRFLVTAPTARGTTGSNYICLPLVELTDE